MLDTKGRDLVVSHALGKHGVPPLHGVVAHGGGDGLVRVRGSGYRTRVRVRVSVGIGVSRTSSEPTRTRSCFARDMPV